MRRLSAFVLLGLLALGPFLHAHFGQAHEHGFHLDGLQWHSHAIDADTASFTADDEHETPAVGVTTSLTRESLDVPQTQDLLSWACAVVLLVLPQIFLTCMGLTSPAQGRVRRLLPGQPPPALAPPALA